MSEIVFILGAGASRCLGAPLMGDFFEKARELERKGQLKDHCEDFKKVFEVIADLQVIYAKAIIDIDNLEHVFGLLDMADLIRRLPGVEENVKISDIADSLKRVIAHTLEESISVQKDCAKTHKSFSQLLARLSEQQRSVSVITFNYDVALDFLCGPTAGFTHCLKGGNGSPAAIPLLKLHGSLNWYLCSKCRSICTGQIKERGDSRDATLTHYYSTPPRKCGLCDRDEFNPNERVEPLIVPPTWNKGNHQSGLCDVWERAAEELSTAEYISVSGYSLPETDSFFKYLYGLGSVGQRPIRRFLVYDPDPSGGVDSRFRAFLGPRALNRYEYSQQDFKALVQRAGQELGV